MSFWAYMLQCADDSYYVGHTEDLEKRMWEHHTAAHTGYTSTRRPVSLVWMCEFSTRIEALESERRIKGWSRAKKQALMRDDWEAIHLLAAGSGRPSTPGAQRARALRSGQTDSPPDGSGTGHAVHEDGYKGS